jgi:hypothetical protein
MGTGMYILWLYVQISYRREYCTYIWHNENSFSVESWESCWAEWPVECKLTSFTHFDTHFAVINWLLTTRYFAFRLLSTQQHTNHPAWAAAASLCSCCHSFSTHYRSVRLIRRLSRWMLFWAMPRRCSSTLLALLPCWYFDRKLSVSSVYCDLVSLERHVRKPHVRKPHLS